MKKTTLQGSSGWSGILLSFALIIILFSWARNASAQTTLIAGDIAFTGFNSNDNSVLANEFSFVILRSGGISAGTVINFTDNGWNTKLAPPALGTIEGVVVWTASSALPQFTEIKIKVTTAGTGISTISSGSATVTGTFLLSQGGDQVLAYQGSATSPTFIAGVHYNSNTGSASNNPTTEAGWDDLTGGTSPYSFTSSTSGIPTGLTNGVNALLVAGGTATPYTEYDNGEYNCTGATGATVSDIRTAINNRSNWKMQDVTAFTLPSGCVFSLGTPATITTQPSAASVCEGSNATFSVTASNATGYQWQVDQGSGFTNLSNAAPYSGVTTSTLTVSGTTAGLNGYSYRVIVSGATGSPVTSSSVALTVNTVPSVVTQPSNSTICAGSNTSFSVSASGTGLTYQWQVDQGAGFTNLSNTSPYSGVTTSTLTVTGASQSLDGYKYRVVVSGTCTPAATSSAATLTINTPPAVTTQPTGSTVCAGSNTTFSVSATGAGLTYQWQLDQGTGFANLSNTSPYSGTSTATLTITGATQGLNNNQYRVVVSGTCTPPVISNAATLTVNAAPAISTQPSASAICAGGNATFSVSATGAGLTYQWQVDPGTGFTNLSNSSPYSGVTTSTLTITGATPILNNYQYRVIVNGACTPAVTSNAATLSFIAAPVILTQPSNSGICAGGNTTFSVSASSGLTYQWQVDPGTGFTNLSNSTPYSGATTSTLTITGATSGLNGNQYRVVVSGACSPAATSNAATLSINSAPAISTQPVNSTICAGSNTTFTVSATGSGLGYQWQVDQGAGFVNVSNTSPYSGATTSTLTITAATAGLNNNQYRVSVSNGCGPAVNSNAVTLIVNPAPAISTQPSNSAVCSGSNASFSVSATGASLTYQWQADQGAGFTNLSNTSVYSGVTTSTLTVTGATQSLNSNQYRVIVSGACTPSVTSNAATLTINTVPSIGTQPSNSTICAGSNTTFSVSASGTGLTYQWQVGQGAGFTNLSNTSVYSGATTSTLTITGSTLSLDGNQYRVIVSGTCSPAVTSNAASLTVNPSATIVTQPKSVAVCAGENASFTVVATGTGLTYQWQTVEGSGFVDLTNDGTYSGVTTSTLTLTGVSSDMDGSRYQVVVGGTCVPGTISDLVTLTVHSAPAITTQPHDSAACAGSNAAFTIAATGAGLTYRWQVNQGNGYQNLQDTSVYSGTSTATLALSDVLPRLNGNKYRVIAMGTCTPNDTSSAAVLTINSAPVISKQPVNTSVCPNGNTEFVVVANGTGLTYQWQVKGTSGFMDLVNGAPYAGVHTANLLITGAADSLNGVQYQVLVKGTCTPDVTSALVTLSVQDITDPVFTKCPSDVVITAGVYTYDVPQATDNCHTPVVKRIAGLGSGATFPEGVTTETYVATDASGNTDTCSFTITANTSTGITGSTDLTWSVYPNPANGTINISSDYYKGMTAEIECRDHSGRTVRVLTVPSLSDQVSLNVEDLPQGLYFVTVTIGDKRLTKAVMVY